MFLFVPYLPFRCYFIPTFVGGGVALLKTKRKHLLSSAADDLKLMIPAINRTDRCIPWSVFARQLDSQHLGGDLCTGLCTSDL